MSLRNIKSRSAKLDREAGHIQHRIDQLEQQLIGTRQQLESVIAEQNKVEFVGVEWETILSGMEKPARAKRERWLSQLSLSKESTWLIYCARFGRTPDQALADGANGEVGS